MLYMQKGHCDTVSSFSLNMQQQERAEQCQTLTAKAEDLERNMESMRAELEAERLSKERKLRKLTTEREKEVAEHKKQLASITQELETEKQKPPPVQEVTPSLAYLSE